MVTYPESSIDPKLFLARPYPAAIRTPQHSDIPTNVINAFYIFTAFNQMKDMKQLEAPNPEVKLLPAIRVDTLNRPLI